MYIEQNIKAFIFYMMKVYFNYNISCHEEFQSRFSVTLSKSDYDKISLLFIIYYDCDPLCINYSGFISDFRNKNIRISGLIESSDFYIFYTKYIVVDK